MMGHTAEVAECDVWPAQMMEHAVEVTECGVGQTIVTEHASGPSEVSACTVGRLEHRNKTVEMRDHSMCNSRCLLVGVSS